MFNARKARKLMKDAEYNNILKDIEKQASEGSNHLNLFRVNLKQETLYKLLKNGFKVNPGEKSSDLTIISW